MPNVIDFGVQDSSIAKEVIIDETTYSLVKFGKICVLTLNGFTPTGGEQDIVGVTSAYLPEKSARGVAISADLTKMARLYFADTYYIRIKSQTTNIAYYGSMVWTIV